MNEEEELQKALEEQERRAQEEYDEATKGNEEIRKKREGDQQLDIPGLDQQLGGTAFEIGANLALDAGTSWLLGVPEGFLTKGLYGIANVGGSAIINAIAQKMRGDKFSLGELVGTSAASLIPGAVTGKGVARSALRGATTAGVEQNIRSIVDDNEVLGFGDQVSAFATGGVLGTGFDFAGKGINKTQFFQGLAEKMNKGKSNLYTDLVNAAISGDSLVKEGGSVNIPPPNRPKGSADPTGAGSERFLFGEDVFANLPEANRKALAKLGITDNESKLFISKYNNIGRDSAGAVESVFTTYNDFEKTKSAVFPFFAEEMKNVTQTKTPQLDHVAQLVASLGFFDGQPVKYWPEIAKIVVNEGVFGLGHDPNNLKYLAFDVHTVKSNFWRDNIGDAGEKFFKGRDLSTLPKLRAAAREYAGIIRKSNKLVETANAQYKLLNKTDISQAELEEFISRLGSDALQSKYNIKQVKSILQQMEEDGFLVKPKTSQAKEERVIKSEQKVTKEKRTRQTKIDQEIEKSIIESETYKKYYASDIGKFKSPLVKGSKDDTLITHAEDIYEEMSIKKDPKTKAAIIKKIMKIIKPRYNG